MKATCRVRCSGHMHKISIAKSGALVFHGHPNGMKAERAFAALGGEPCRCLQVLDAWKIRKRQKLPAVLQLALDETVKRKNEQMLKIHGGIDRLKLPIDLRVARKVSRYANEALKKCSYRRSQSTWAGGNHHISVVVKPEIDISGSTNRVWSKNGKWSGNDSYINAAVALTWYSRVYRRGLAVIDGIFVLDVLSEDEKGYTVLAGKQGRGFSVNPHRARVTKTKDGSYRLRWIKKEYEGQTKPETIILTKRRQ